MFPGRRASISMPSTHGCLAQPFHCLNTHDKQVAIISCVHFVHPLLRCHVHALGYRAPRSPHTHLLPPTTTATRIRRLPTRYRATPAGGGRHAAHARACRCRAATPAFCLRGQLFAPRHTYLPFHMPRRTYFHMLYTFPLSCTSLYMVLPMPWVLPFAYTFSAISCYAILHLCCLPAHTCCTHYLPAPPPRACPTPCLPPSFLHLSAAAADAWTFTDHIPSTTATAWRPPTPPPTPAAPAHQQPTYRALTLLLPLGDLAPLVDGGLFAVTG